MSFDEDLRDELKEGTTREGNVEKWEWWGGGVGRGYELTQIQTTKCAPARTSMGKKIHFAMTGNMLPNLAKENEKNI